MLRTSPAVPPASTVAWYDAHAEQLANGYEGLEAATVHHQLFGLIAGSPRMRILDVGAGTGRDAAALAAMGHDVTAVEPSAKMLRLGRTLHAASPITWSSDAMPALAHQRGPFDLVMLSAVWMHVPPSQRGSALKRLVALTSGTGMMYMTLRIGPADPDRGMFDVDLAELRRLSAAEHLEVTELGDQHDLLGRAGVSWKTVLLRRPQGA